MQSQRAAIARLLRSFPSLNLRINVSRSRNEVDVVLPGLRYDDIANTGMPDIWRVYDMVSKVEFAAFFHEIPFLNYDVLFHQNITSIIKAVRMDIKTNFYEITTPKAPLDVLIRLSYIGDSSFMTVCGVNCGGKMKPSIMLKNLHTFIDVDSKESVQVPDWWKKKHEKDVTNENPFIINSPISKSETYNHEFTVPFSDADVYSRTQCASYVRYFNENASIASRKNFYDNISTKFHNYCIRRVSMLYSGPSMWGDVLTSKTWEDNAQPLTLHCNIEKENKPVWYGCFEFHPEIFGLQES